MSRLSPRLALAGWLLLTAAVSRAAPAAGPADLEFFEKKIRPLLIERCYECHSAEPGHKIKAGLRLDHAAGWLQGGDSGPAVLPGKVDESPLIKAIRYSGLDFEAMPPKSSLSKSEIALLEEWVKRGAPAPTDSALKIAGGATGAASGRQTGMSVEDGKKFWSFVAPTAVAVPTVSGALKHWP
eukprot:gene15090-19992_t